MLLKVKSIFWSFCKDFKNIFFLLQKKSKDSFLKAKIRLTYTDKGSKHSDISNLSDKTMIEFFSVAGFEISDSQRQ